MLGKETLKLEDERRVDKDWRREYGVFKPDSQCNSYGNMNNNG